MQFLLPGVFSMIRTRFGTPVTVVRLATLDDILRCEGGPSTNEDRANVSNKSVVLCKREDGSEMTWHIASLRADGGAAEIYKEAGI